MYDFFQKSALKSRAKVADIDTYRTMLSELRNPAAGWMTINTRELAEDMLYILLDTYTIEEIEARVAASRHQAPKQPQQSISITPEEPKTGSELVKKKSINTKSIQKSTGEILKAMISGLRTVYSRIGSAAGKNFTK